MLEALVDAKPHDHALIHADDEENEHDLANNEDASGRDLDAGKAYWDVQADFDTDPDDKLEGQVAAYSEYENIMVGAVLSYTVNTTMVGSDRAVGFHFLVHARFWCLRKADEGASLRRKLTL